MTKLPPDVVEVGGSHIGAKDLDPGPIRWGSGILPASSPQHHVSGFARLACQLVGEAALANAWLTANEDQSAIAPRSVIHRDVQVFELTIATDEPAAALGWPKVHAFLHYGSLRSLPLARPAVDTRSGSRRSLSIARFPEGVPCNCTAVPPFLTPWE